MKIASIIAGSIFLFSLAFSSAFAGEEDYRTSDGKLLNKLEVAVSEGGFIPQGTRYVIGTDGAWTATDFALGQPDRTREGTLSNEDLDKLVKELVRYNLKELKDEGELVVNASQVSIRFGQLGGTLTTPPGALPAPDPKTMAGRYGGILIAVRDILRPARPLAGPGEMCGGIGWIQCRGELNCQIEFEDALRPDASGVCVSPN